MEQNLQHILIFKTNIKTEADRQTVKKLLDAHSCIRQWNVDLQDIDCVLRIVLRQAQDDRPSLTTTEAIALVNRHGYECSELL
ncbi:MAG TPA: hypothetical protein VLD19_15295 [Chitinophagaceae bacterium]|nr:hypothetical protein [Chitinophagaceae bacterium]